MTDVATQKPEQASAVARRADVLEGLIRIGIENGLFVRDHQDFEPMIAAVAKGRTLAAEGKPAVAASELTRGEHLFHRQLYEEKGFGWRLLHLHQIHVLLYYLVVTICLLNIGTGYWDFVGTEVYELPMAALVLGALGAVLRGLWWLYRHVSKRTFRVSFILPHLAAPWIGALFGLFTYLLLLAGVVSLEGPQGSGGGIDQAALPLALAFLAGFSWEWMLERVDRLRNQGGGAPPSDAPSTPPAPPPDQQDERQDEPEGEENVAEGGSEAEKPAGAAAEVKPAAERDEHEREK